MKFYRLGCFIVALIIAVCSVAVTAANLRNIMQMPDKWLLLVIFTTIAVLCAALVIITVKEIKS